MVRHWSSVDVQLPSRQYEAVRAKTSVILLGWRLAAGMLLGSTLKNGDLLAILP